MIQDFSIWWMASWHPQQGTALLNWVHELLHRANWGIRTHLITLGLKKKIKNWAVFRQLNRFKTKQYYHCHEIPMNGDLCIISTFIYYGDTSGYPGTQNKIYQKVQTHKWPLTGGQEQKTTHYSRTNILLRDILGEDPLSYKNTQEWCLSAY